MSQEILGITMTINEAVNHLINYGLKKHLLHSEDVIYARNKILAQLKLTNFEEIAVTDSPSLVEILKVIDEYAFANKLIAGQDVTYYELFDTNIMDCLMPRPSEVSSVFNALYHQDCKLATSYFYELSQASNYIRMDRIRKNLVWKTPTEYGDLDITINLSKPEKDPKVIAMLKNLPSNNYPKCALCYENVGFSGSLNQAPRQNHRVIEISVNDEKWYFQYSPYVYYNEHCILFKAEHVPMKISTETFKRLLDFVELFPHYFLGSNADLPIVGGSILSHEHFQGGHYEFAFTKAKTLKSYYFAKYPDVTVEYLNWPLDTLRLTAPKKADIVFLADEILKGWKQYSDVPLQLLCETGGTAHNTITPIARTTTKNGQMLFQLDLVLRNNRIDELHPEGIFHPDQKLHHIKKENIGLIEVMGLAVLPARLKHEINCLRDVLLNKQDSVILETEELRKHHEWYDELKRKYHCFETNKIDDLLRTEIGLKFKAVLECCSVFKYGHKIEAMDRFIEKVKNVSI